MSSSRRGCTPFSGSSNASSDPLQGFAAMEHNARTRRVPSEMMRED